MDPPTPLISDLRARVAHLKTFLADHPHLPTHYAEEFGTGIWYEAFDTKGDWKRPFEHHLVYHVGKTATAFVGDLALGALARETQPIIVIDAAITETSIYRATWFPPRTEPVIEVVEAKKQEVVEFGRPTDTVIEEWVRGALDSRGDAGVLHIEFRATETEVEMRAAEWFNMDHEAVAELPPQFRVADKETIVVWLWDEEAGASELLVMDTSVIGPATNDELVRIGIDENAGPIEDTGGE